MKFNTPESAENLDQVEHGPDLNHMSWSAARVDENRDATHHQLKGIVAMSDAHPATEGGETSKDGASKKEDKKLDPVQKLFASAQEKVETYVDFKPAEKPVVKKSETHAKKEGEEGKKSSLKKFFSSLGNGIAYLAEGTWNNGKTLLKGGAIGAGMAAAVGADLPLISTAHNILQSVPFIGPTITSTAGSIWSWLGNTATRWGLETGATATNGLLSMIPWTSAGPIALGLAGLYAAGKTKQLFTRKEYKGIAEPMKEALKIPLEVLGGAANYSYKFLMNSPSYALKIPLKAAEVTYNTGKKLIGKRVEWAYKNMVSPRKLGFAMAALGGLALAPFTGGSSALLAGAGYVAGNTAQNLAEASGSGDAHGGHGGGHH